MIHDLKTWPVYFEEICKGRKKFELRKNDRGFGYGHTLMLHEYDPYMGYYTGRIIQAEVTYITDAGLFLQPGYVCMSIKVIGGWGGCKIGL